MHPFSISEDEEVAVETNTTDTVKSDDEDFKKPDAAIEENAKK